MTDYQKTIVHFSQDFEKEKPQLGGFSRVYNICSDHNKHIIYTVSTNIDYIDSYKIDNILIVQIPVKERPMGVYNQIRMSHPIGKQVAKHLRQSGCNPDLFFGHSQLGNFLILKKAKELNFMNKPLIWEANGIGGVPKMYSGTLKQKVSHWVLYRLQKFVFQKSDFIIAQTSDGKEFIKQEFGIYKDKIEVISNAIRNTDKAIIKKDFDKISILCFGLFDALNGIPFLLEVLKKESITQHFEFSFAGFGPYVNEVKTLARKLNNVHYLGQYTHKEMLDLLPKFHFFIIPRLDNLGSHLYIPTKLLEGMHHGVVPICSDVGGMTGVVNSENGFIFRKESKASLIDVLKEIQGLDIETYNKKVKSSMCIIQKEFLWSEKHLEINSIYNQLCT